MARFFATQLTSQSHSPPLTHAAMQCTSLQGSKPRYMQCVCTSPSSALDLDSAILPFCGPCEVSRPVRFPTTVSHPNLISSRNIVCTWDTISYIASQLALSLICFTQFSLIKRLARYKYRVSHIILPFFVFQFLRIPLPPLVGQKHPVSILSNFSASDGVHMP